MKKVTIYVLMLIATVFGMSSCEKDETPIIEALQGNEYLIKMDGNVLEQGSNIYAGIATDLSDENVMQAGTAPALSILFDKDNYIEGNILTAGLDTDSPNVTAYATGVLILNKDSENEEMVSYVATAGTATIVSKKKLEFNLTCYRFADMDIDGFVSGAIPFVLSGYVTENSPE